jgi:predicted RNA-binding protein with EMAP domain
MKILKLRDAIKTLSVAYSKIESLSSLKNNDDLNNDVHKENFIKFLSDSRDWAYAYIEDIQEGVSNFVNEIEPEIAYFDEYGLVGDAYPHYHSMKKISSEYKELKKLLPEKDE